MISCNFLGESDASGTVDASVHVGDDERANVFILNCSLVLVIPSSAKAVEVGVVLEITFSSLIADWTV